MRYIGGKGRIADEMAKVMLSLTEQRDVYREPFVGGAAVLERMAPNFDRSYAGDTAPDLVLMWQGLLGGGFEPPETLDFDEWRRLRDEKPSALRGYAGYAMSFGSHFFRGYAVSIRENGHVVDHAGANRRSLLKTREALRGVNVSIARESYDRVRVNPGDVVYCDPPYADTLIRKGDKYNYAEFDSKRFWLRAQRWVDQGATVFVSEYKAPSRGWECVWEKELRQTLVPPGFDRDARLERLFARKP